MDDSDAGIVDVVVVGAGPSGAIVAHTLAKAGIGVVCLEQGDWTSPADYPANFAMWEVIARSHWQTEPNFRRNKADYPMEMSETDLNPSMYNAVGGSTIHFGGLWPRLTVSDFRVRTLDGVADDWPIRYEDLVADYDEIDRFIGVAGLEGDPAYPEGLSPPQPAHPLGKTGMSAAAALNKLGWHWWPAANAIPTQKHGSLAACVRWGTCVQGCPQGAKGSADMAFWPAAIAAGAQLVTGARVSKVTSDDLGTVTGVDWIKSGTRRHTRARYVVLCANGIGTARLLLLSGSERHPAGLANSSGLVGKNLMLHPNCCAMGYYEEDLETWRGPLGSAISSMQFHETDTSRGFVRGCKLHASTAPGIIMNGVDPHRLLPFEQLWGTSFHQVARDGCSTVLWAANIEDLPEETNRVTLDPTLCDEDGIPAPKIQYRFSENTLKIRAFTLARMLDAHNAAGARKVIEVEYMPGEPGHLLGTARMGNDPRTSVVDPFGRAHDCDNLLIADGSIFVTGGSANPTSTICALALRIGRNLVDVFRAANPSNQRSEPIKDNERSASNQRLSVSKVRSHPRREFTPAEIHALRSVADTLIPRSGEFPSGSGVAEFDALATQAMTILDAHFDQVTAVLAELATVPADELWDRLRVMNDSRSDDFYWLSMIVVAAYLYSPEMLRTLNYPLPHPNPAGMFQIAEELEGGILDPVIERGEIYVRAQ